ncbi:MAG TPA: hypothetical protein VJR02_07845 [Pyrinomonadaceae bacterium]|nr:hypothetical protein [Pyrinomonadaceae bacterium]
MACKHTSSARRILTLGHSQYHLAVAGEYEVSSLTEEVETVMPAKYGVCAARGALYCFVTETSEKVTL